MSRSSCMLVAGASVAALVVACSSSDIADDRFACGKGSCARDREVCMIGGTDRCSTCVAIPARCGTAPTCGCLPGADDAELGSVRCSDRGTCAEVEGGQVLTCDQPSWRCG